MMKRILTRMSQVFRHENCTDVTDLVPSNGDSSQLRLCKSNEPVIPISDQDPFLVTDTEMKEQYLVEDILTPDVNNKEMVEHSTCLFDSRSIHCSDSITSDDNHQISDQAGKQASSLSLEDSWSEGDPIPMADIDDWLAEQLDGSSLEEGYDSYSKEIGNDCSDLVNGSDSNCMNDITIRSENNTSQCSKEESNNGCWCKSSASPVNEVKSYKCPEMASPPFYGQTNSAIDFHSSLENVSITPLFIDKRGSINSERLECKPQFCAGIGGRTLFRSVSYPGNHFLSMVADNGAVLFRCFSSSTYSEGKQSVCLNNNCNIAVSRSLESNLYCGFLEGQRRVQRDQPSQQSNSSPRKNEQNAAMRRLVNSEVYNAAKCESSSMYGLSANNTRLDKDKTHSSQQIQGSRWLQLNLPYLERRTRGCIASINSGSSGNHSLRPLQTEHGLSKECVIIHSDCQGTDNSLPSGHTQFNMASLESNGGRLVTKRQGCAEVVQIVGKVAPLSIIPDLKQSAPESVDESCSELLSPPPPPHCACSDRSCSADTDSDEQQQQQQLRNVSDRLASSEDQAAQLLGDTQQLLYQLELLKDELQEEQEQRRSLQRLHQTLDQQHDQLQKFSKQLQVQLDSCQDQLNERQTLLKKHGLVMVGGATGEMARGEAAALISQTSASLLQSAGNGSLESRIRRLASERNMLEGRIVALKNDLENSRTENAQRASETLDQELLQRRAEKLKQEYSEKLKKSEQELNTLHATMLRLETQAHRQRMHAQQIESNEDELRAEKRKLKKQLRESQSRIEELESCNSHLNKRMDKLNTVLKELTSPPPQQA